MRREAKLLHTDGELRARPQQHAAQAGAARNAASRLHAACVPGRSPQPADVAAHVTAQLRGGAQSGGMGETAPEGAICAATRWVLTIVGLPRTGNSARA